MFKVGDLVCKVGGAYGGPGVVTGRFAIDPSVPDKQVRELDWRYNVAHKIEGGYGRLIHIYGAAQLARGDHDLDFGKPPPVLLDDRALARLRKTALLCQSMISVGLVMIIMEWLR